MASQLPLPVTAPPKKWTIKPKWFGSRKRKRNTETKESDSLNLTAQSSPDDDPDTLEPGQKPPAMVAEADVLTAVNMHKCFELPSLAPDTKVTDLPNLEDVTKYGVSEEEQDRMWSNEVSRLLEAVTTDTPLEFLGSGSLGGDTKASYETLAALAVQAWQAMNIISYDGECVLAAHSIDLCDVDALRKSRMILDRLCNQSENTEDSVEEVPHVARKDFVDLVDYCTAILARILCATVDGKSLHINLLAYLAKVSTKLKVVSAKLQDSSLLSVHHGVLDREIPLPNHQETREERDSTYPSFNKNSLVDSSLYMLGELRALDGSKSDMKTSSKKDSMRKLYFLQCAKFRKGIFFMLRFLLLSLRGTNNPTRSPVTPYEICAMVHETGFDRFPILVYQDRDNDFLGTSDALNINYARGPFDVLHQAVRHVCSQIRDISASNNGRKDSSLSDADTASLDSDEETLNVSNCESVGTRISWSYSPHTCDSESPKDSIMLKSMSHVVTVMVPLIMTSPVAIYCIEAFREMAILTDSLSERQMNPVKCRPYDKYTAFFCLTTEEYRTAQKLRGPDDAKSLSNTPIKREHLFPKKRATKTGLASKFALHSIRSSHSSSEDDGTAAEQIRKSHRAFENVNKKMKKWAFEEKGVMVRCRAYVCTVLFFCAILVVGFIALEIMESDWGMDPLNIMTSCWALAAFVIFAAKHIHVQDWTWNDFLHGRVLCKSVSELSSITGVDEQLILAKLLQEEPVSFLQTSGPYNSVFRSDSQDGFSIDRPLTMWAMLLSGLIMIEVESARGLGIVCLDLRRGTEFSIIQNIGSSGSASEVEFIHCKRLPDDTGRETHGHPTRIKLAKGDMTWLRAVGFYGKKDTKLA